MTPRQSKKSKGNDQAQTPDRKLCHGQKNGWVYWLSCLGQGFTTKASFLRLMYKLTLAHFHSSQPNLGLEFYWRVWTFLSRTQNTLRSRYRNLKSQNVFGSQRKTLISPSRKVWHLPFVTRPKRSLCRGVRVFASCPLHSRGQQTCKFIGTKLNFY